MIAHDSTATPNPTMHSPSHHWWVMVLTQCESAADADAVVAVAELSSTPQCSSAPLQCTGWEPWRSQGPDLQTESWE